MKKAVVFMILIGALFASSAPYSLKKFKEVLAISKLQAPTSHYDRKWGAKYGKFRNFSNKYFYLSDKRYMTFYMCQNQKKKRRSELRFKEDWKVTTKVPKVLESRLKVMPLSVKKEFTFLQIHTDGTLINQPVINLPLLRIVWQKKYKNIKNHIWAIIRMSAKRKIYKKIDLGVLPKGFFDFKIKVQKSILFIYTKQKTYKLNISYWDKYQNYYKVGVYLQGIGCAKVLFAGLLIGE